MVGLPVDRVVPQPPVYQVHVVAPVWDGVAVSLLSRTAEGTGWKVYATGILAVNLAVFLLNWIVSGLFPADVRLVDVVYLVAHGPVLAWAVYRPIVRRWVSRVTWPSSCWRRCPSSSPSRSTSGSAATGFPVT